MIHITNATDEPQVYEGFTVPPGYCVLPGPAAVVYLSDAPPVVETPDYLTSFGLGMLVMLPCCSVLVARRLLSLLKPTTLDRYV